MNQSDYLRHAAYCEQMAATATDPATAKAYRQAAASWQHLAELSHERGRLNDPTWERLKPSTGDGPSEGGSSL